MNSYTGVIIEESLENKDILKEIKIISTKVEQVTNDHQTPWLSQWTLRTVEVPENIAQSIAQEISKSLDHTHGGAWYADFKNATTHFIIYPHKIFKVDHTSAAQYAEAKKYGIALGIPEYQVDFSPEIK